MADGGEECGSGAYSQDDGNLVFTLASPLTIPAGGSVEFLVIYDFVPDTEQ